MREGKVPVYGFVIVDDPRDFEPNEEECSPGELAAHAEALAKANAGVSWADPVRPHWVGNAIHLCVSSWGMGTNWIPEEEIE
jgi:hypothetical protein